MHHARLTHVASELLWEPRFAGTVSATAYTAIPGYDPGKLACTAGLVGIPATPATAPDGTRYYEELAYAPPDPAHPECAIQFCDEDENPIAEPYDPGILAALNAPAAVTDSCPAIGGSGAECPVNPDPALLGGACQTSADCAAGELCAIRCTGETCDNVEHRCGRPYASCDGIPAASSYCDPRVFRECAPSNVSGEVVAADVLAKLPRQAEPAATASVPDAAKVAVAPEYPSLDSETLCANRSLGHLSDVPTKQEGAPHVDEGNATWGIFFSPVFEHEATLGRYEMGEATFRVGGKIGIVAGANIMGERVTVLDAEARANAERCGIDAGATLKFFGETIDVGPQVRTFAEVREACEQALRGRDEFTASVRSVMVAARKVQDFYRTHGNTTSLCAGTAEAFNATFDCANPTNVDVPNRWKQEYEERVRTFIQKDEALAWATRRISEEGVLPLYDARHRYEASILNVTVPIGPIPLTLAVAGFGSWGFSGGVQYGVSFGGVPGLLAGAAETTPASDDVHAFAGPIVRPGLDIGVSLFLGVGLPAVSVGVEGSVALLAFELPFDARAGLMRVSEPDPRYGTLAGSDWAGAPIAGVRSDRAYRWVTGWAFGAKTDLELLSGRLDLAARVNLLFFKKTFRKKLADWKGVVLPGIVMAGGASGEPLQAHDHYGQHGDKLPLTTLAELTPSDPISSLDVNAKYTDVLLLPEAPNIQNRCSCGSDICVH